MTDFTRLKNDIERLKMEVSKTEGSLVELRKQEEVLMKELKEKHNIDNLEDVDKELDKLDNELVGLEVKINEEAGKLKEIMR